MKPYACRNCRRPLPSPANARTPCACTAPATTPTDQTRTAPAAATTDLCRPCRCAGGTHTNPPEQHVTDQPRERHITRHAGFRPTTPPDDRRPYRRASESGGSEMRTHTLDADQHWRQIGWHGQTGAFYALDEKPSDHEPGSWSPLWLLVDNEPPILPDRDETEGGEQR